MSIQYSIVIPTYNRMDVLPEVLGALDAQQGAPPFEVVVVDDGSTDDTRRFLEQRTARQPVRVLVQENLGPGVARNRGVAAAEGPWVAFLGDDTVPSPGWLAAHAAARDRHDDAARVAIIGYTAWHSRMRLNPFLRYINEFGLQFGYALIDDAEDVPFNFFYTSNLSLARALLLAEPFDARFPYPAWEDIEVSYRLKKRDVRLIYVPQATVAHDHPTDLDRFMVRQEKAGYSAVVFGLLHPELEGFLGLGPDGPPALPAARRQRWRETLARRLQKLPVRTPQLWEDVLRFHYIRGLHRGWHDRARLAKGEQP